MGFDNAGFTCAFANDIEPKTKITYDANFPSSSDKTDNKTKLHIEDIYDISPSYFPHFDVLTGGFPCQSFSCAGKRLGFSDGDRGNLFFQIADILRIRKPKAFLLENVKNLVSHDNGKTFEVVLNTLKDLGYYVHYKVLNTKDFGVPQNRQRIFIVGFREDVPFEFPTGQPLTTRIQDLLEPLVDSNYFITEDHRHAKPILEGVLKSDTVYQWRRNYLRENKSKVCPTITASMNGVLTLVKTDAGVRQVTPRELFRFQGFPDSYVLPDLSYQALHHQAGNSVSVPVIEAIARQMKMVLTL